MLIAFLGFQPSPSVAKSVELLYISQPQAGLAAHPASQARFQCTVPCWLKRSKGQGCLGALLPGGRCILMRNGGPGQLDFKHHWRQLANGNDRCIEANRDGDHRCFTGFPDPLCPLAIRLALI